MDASQAAQEAPPAEASTDSACASQTQDAAGGATSVAAVGEAPIDARFAEIQQFVFGPDPAEDVVAAWRQGFVCLPISTCGARARLNGSGGPHRSVRSSAHHFADLLYGCCPSPVD